MSFSFPTFLTNIPFLPNTPSFDPANPNATESNDSLGTAMDTLMVLGNEGTLKVVDWGIKAITIVFILGVILMILAMIFKVGQWQKLAQTTILWSFIAMLLFRAIPITILSFQSEIDVDQAFQALLGSLGKMAIFLSIAGIMLSLLFRLAYKLIKHPEYHRWSKNIISISVIMILFATVGPILFGIM